MKIIIDIGHPAHVHYFKNFIWIMKKRGHQFLVTSRDKEITHYLLNYYQIPFISRGKGQKGFIGKALYIVQADYMLYKYAKKFHPDLFLSFGSPYAAHVSKLLGKPHIALDDTEHAKFEHIMYVPFTDSIITPFSFKKSFGNKQVSINSLMELFYLHPQYFIPNKQIYNNLGITTDDKYVIVRFVSWEASHDFNAHGITLNNKLKLVKQISKYARVFISSEGALPQNLTDYQLRIDPEKIHDALAFSSLFIGESGTMSSECAVLGTPNIQIRHTLELENVPGVHLDLVEKGMKLLRMHNDIEGIINKSIEILQNYQSIKSKIMKRRTQMLANSIDITKFLCWFIENYPKSKKIRYKTTNTNKYLL